MANRRLRIELECDAGTYKRVANLIWHVMHAAEVPDFDIFHDGRQSDRALNDAWDDLGKIARWSKR